MFEYVRVCRGVVVEGSLGCPHVGDHVGGVELADEADAPATDAETKTPATIALKNCPDMPSILATETRSDTTFEQVK